MPPEQQQSRSYDKGHGRPEIRVLTSTVSLNTYIVWRGVKQVCKVERTRVMNGQTSQETASYITSLSRSKADAATLQKVIRRHWGAIENGLHWVCDMALGQERSTVTKGFAPENLASLRNAALASLQGAGYEDTAPTMRNFARQIQRFFSFLGYCE